MIDEFERYFITTDGDTLWLDHYPTDDDQCAGSPICSVEPGDTLAKIVEKASGHTCEAQS